MTQRRLPGMPGNSYTRQAQHDRAHVGGEAEKLADELHKACALAGVAWVERVCSNVKITKYLGHGRVEGVLTGNSVVDAMGWMADGRAVALEIKHLAVEYLKDRSEAAWRLPLSRIEDHQRTMLARCHLAGGVALVLVVHGGRAYAVPWPVVDEALRAGKASLLEDEIKPHLCPPGRPYLARWITRGEPCRP